MASFVVEVDPRADRRAAYCADAARRIAPLAGLATGSCGSASFHALWARDHM